AARLARRLALRGRDRDQDLRATCGASTRDSLTAEKADRHAAVRACALLSAPPAAALVCVESISLRLFSFPLHGSVVAALGLAGRDGSNRTAPASGNGAIRPRGISAPPLRSDLSRGAFLHRGRGIRGVSASLAAARSVGLGISPAGAVRPGGPRSAAALVCAGEPPGDFTFGSLPDSSLSALRGLYRGGARSFDRPFSRTRGRGRRPLSRGPLWQVTRSALFLALRPVRRARRGCSRL